MKRARVAGYKNHQNGFGIGKFILMTIGFCFSLIMRLVLPRLPLVIIIGMFFLPKTPHLLVTYKYRGAKNDKYFTECGYFGKNGWVHEAATGECPLISFIGKRVQH